MTTTDFASITIDDRLLARLDGSTGVLVATGREPDRPVEIARRAAAMLAARLGATLFVSDRSRRTWGDTPHVDGPLHLDAVRESDAPHLVHQMRDALALGAPDVRAVVPSLPTPDAVSGALAVSGASVVVCPTGFGRLRLLDRWQLRRGIASVVRRRARGATVLVAHPGGRVVEA